MKIAVIANCQTQAISNYLRIITGCKDIVNVPVHMFGSDMYIKALQKLKAVADDERGIIFTFSLSNKFGELETSKLRANSRARVYSITNLYFSGFHPDITYLGSMGKRVESPLGDLHSKTVLTAYTAALSIDEAIASFNSETYTKLGFFDEFDKSKSELFSRDEVSDIKFANEFLELVTSKPALYTMNHPIPEVLYKFVCNLCDYADIPYQTYPPEFFSNFLSNATWWPIYNEIANFHAFKFASPMLFKQPDNKGGNIIPLEELVSKSYHQYNQFGFEAITKAFVL